jgi:L-lactate dehydrogenase
VVSTGTYLDSLRLRLHIAVELGVDPETVDAHVVGEHGTSQVVLCSSATVGATPVSRVFADMHGEDAVAGLREQVEQQVRYANITIIEGNDASQYGIGVASARITEALLADERAVLPVAAHQPRYGVTVSLPSVIGRHGVLHSFEPEMSEAERAGFSRSVETLRQAAARIGVSSTTAA